MNSLTAHPLPGYPVTGGYGWRAAIPAAGRPAEFHGGIDWGAPAGTPIRAAHDGVLSQDWHSIDGNVSFVSNGNFSTKYSHALRYAREPGRVKAGDVIAYVGSSGASTGAHLHFEVRVNGAHRDPVPYLNNIRVSDKDVEQYLRSGKVALYHTTRTVKGKKETTWALAGESPGTSANWLETHVQSFANQLAGQYGNSAELSPKTFDAWKRRYLEPVKTS